MFLYTSILKIHLKLSEQNDVKIRTFHTPITYWWEFWIFKKNQENPDEIGMVAQTGKKLIIVNKRLLDSWALSIQQKYQFEIWKFHMPKGTVHSSWQIWPKLLRINFGYCSCKQDTKAHYWGEQLKLSKGKGHFSLTDRNDQMGQIRSPSN